MISIDNLFADKQYNEFSDSFMQFQSYSGNGNPYKFQEEQPFDAEQSSNILSQKSKTNTIRDSNWCFQLEDTNDTNATTFFFREWKFNQIQNKVEPKKQNDEIKSPQIECNYCERVFEKKHSLGGHMSKVHPGKSENFQKKKTIRKKRTAQRIGLQVIQSHCLKKLQEEQLIM